MSSTFKPLLAYTVDELQSIPLPVLCSPKLDGIRCMVLNDQPVSRTLKLIPNRFVQQELGFYPPFDGELLVGDPTDPSAFNKSTSGIMSHSGSPEFMFHVFDYVGDGYQAMTYEQRLERVYELTVGGRWPRVTVVPHTRLNTVAEVLDLEAYYVGLGYEGLMVRRINGKYKHGRSTAREAILGKIKRFTDTEGIIIGVEELQHNDNEQTTNALGHAERARVSANMRPGDTLGALVVQSPDWEEPFKIGTGLTVEDRFTLWTKRDMLLGKTVRFKFQAAGVKDRPRFPVYLGLRED